MIISEVQLSKSDAEKQFVLWLTTQKNNNGNLFKPYVANRYAYILRTAPMQLDIPLSAMERNVFDYRTVQAFDALSQIFRDAPNYQEVNRSTSHGAFSAGLTVYRNYIQYLEKREKEAMTEKQQSVNSSRVDNATTAINSSDPMRVDFSHPEYCTGCDPVSCFVDGKQFCGRNWRDILIALTEHFLATEPRAYELLHSSVYERGGRPFLLKEKPKNYSRQISNGYWVYLEMSIRNLVFTIGCLCKFCGVNLDDVDIRYVPKSGTGKSNSVMTVESNGSEFAQINKYSEHIAVVPDVLIEALTKNYPLGFRFETTYINLLSNESGIRIDERLLTSLKQIMFHRDDDIFFLLDQATDEDTRKEIIEFADTFLQKYGCFEISEFYKQYQERFNFACIRNADDFECFYEQIAGGQVRCVRAPQVGNRIARHINRNMRTIFDEVAGEIVAIIKNKYYGSCTEDDLHKEFCAFSKDLLSKIIKNFVANELIRVEINGSICYQSFEALGLPEDFSDILSTTLERLNEIGLEPSQEVLHTALSLDLGVNLKSELSLPDWDTYRRLIATYYKGEPRREWRNNVFREVED